MLHHWKIIFLNTPTPPSPLLDQLWPHLTTFLLLSILINSQLQEMEKGNVFFSWRDTEVSFRGSRGMWQSQHSSSSTQSHSGMLDMLELQDTSEKSPTTNTTWFWGGPGQGCSQFGKMILQRGRVQCWLISTLKSQLSAPDFQVSPKYQVDLTLLCLQESTEKKNQNKDGNE